MASLLLDLLVEGNHLASHFYLQNLVISETQGHSPALFISLHAGRRWLEFVSEERRNPRDMVWGQPLLQALTTHNLLIHL